MSPSLFDLGKIPHGDRAQRLLIGGALMLLTLTGLPEQSTWRSTVALALQAELLLTGLFGWCPVYWGCRLASPNSTTPPT